MLAVVRAAARHDVRLQKDLEPAENAHDDVEENRRRQHRNGNVPELPQRPRAVHFRGLIQAARHALQAGQVDDHAAAHGPQIHQNHGKFGPTLVGQPARTADAQVGQKRVQKPEIAVENPLPEQGDGHAGDDARQKENRPEHPDAEHFLVHQEGNQHAQHRVQGNAERHVVQRVAQAFPEQRILGEHDLVIKKTDPLGRTVDVVGRKAQIQRKQNRKRHE